MNLFTIVVVKTGITTPSYRSWIDRKLPTKRGLENTVFQEKRFVFISPHVSSSTLSNNVTLFNSIFNSIRRGFAEGTKSFCFQERRERTVRDMNRNESVLDRRDLSPRLHPQIAAPCGEGKYARNVITLCSYYDCENSPRNCSLNIAISSDTTLNAFYAYGEA